MDGQNRQRQRPLLVLNVPEALQDFVRGARAHVAHKVERVVRKVLHLHATITMHCLEAMHANLGAMHGTPGVGAMHGSSGEAEGGVAEKAGRTTAGSLLSWSSGTAGTILARGSSIASRPPMGACSLHRDAAQLSSMHHAGVLWRLRVQERGVLLLVWPGDLQSSVKRAHHDNSTPIQVVPEAPTSAPGSTPRRWLRSTG